MAPVNVNPSPMVGPRKYRQKIVKFTPSHELSLSQSLPKRSIFLPFLRSKLCLKVWPDKPLSESWGAGVGYNLTGACNLHYFGLFLFDA